MSLINKEIFKYPSGHQQIQNESEEKYLLDKIDWENEILVYIKNADYPIKNFTDTQMLFANNIVKAIFIETLKIFPIWFFILQWKNKQKILDSFNRICFKVISPFILKDKHLSNFGRSFHFVIFNFLFKIGFTESSSDRFAEIFTYTIENDNAYRLRIEDLFSETSKRQLVKNPRKEIKRLTKIYCSRETNIGVANKFKKISFLINLILLIPKIKKTFIQTFQDCDFINLQLDEIDNYWCLMRCDYLFLGLDEEEKKDFIKNKKWKYLNE